MSEQLNIETLIHALPRYDGKTEANIEYYVSQYDQLLEGTKLTEKQKLVILKAKISGKARDILHSNEELLHETNYNKFKGDLINELKFKLSFDEAQEKFMTMKQEAQQSIEEFVKEFNKNAKLYLEQSGHADRDGAKEFLKSIKFTRFLEAIRPDLAYEVRKTGTKDFDEAVKTAKTIETAMNYGRFEEINAVKENNNSQFYENLIKINETQTNQIESLKQELLKCKIGEKEKKTIERKYCEICKKKSHTIENCWFNARQNKFRGDNQPARFQNNLPPVNFWQSQAVKGYSVRQNSYPTQQMTSYANPNFPQTMVPPSNAQYVTPPPYGFTNWSVPNAPMQNWYCQQPQSQEQDNYAPQNDISKEHTNQNYKGYKQKKNHFPDQSQKFYPGN